MVCTKYGIYIFYSYLLIKYRCKSVYSINSIINLTNLIDSNIQDPPYMCKFNIQVNKLENINILKEVNVDACRLQDKSSYV